MDVLSLIISETRRAFEIKRSQWSAENGRSQPQLYFGSASNSAGFVGHVAFLHLVSHSRAVDVRIKHTPVEDSSLLA